MSQKSDDWELWRIDSRRQVLVTNYSGPPEAVCTVTEEGLARQQGQLSTVSQVVFPADCFRTAAGYAAAKALAEAWAAELGYRVVVEDRLEDEEHDFADEDDDDFYDNEWDYDDEEEERLPSEIENDPTDEEGNMP